MYLILNILWSNFYFKYSVFKKFIFQSINWLIRKRLNEVLVAKKLQKYIFLSKSKLHQTYMPFFCFLIEQKLKSYLIYKL